MKPIYQKSDYIKNENNLSVTRRDIEGTAEIHLHNYYELELILEGEGEQNLNGTVYSLKKGTVYLLTPIDFHSLSTEKYVKVINISFDETLISPEWRLLFVNRRKDLIFNAEGQDFENIKYLFFMVEEEINNGELYDTQALRHLTELLFISVARNTVTEKKENKVNTKPYMQYIFQHFREELTLTQIANLSGYTPHYFSALFHNETGRCFTDFLNDLRINYAKMLLDTTSLSVTEIGEKSGFGSQSNFFRVFSQQIGCSPNTYRKNR